MQKSEARWWDLPSAMFLFLILLFSTWRLQNTEWTDDLDKVWDVAFWGMVIGLALGQSIFRRNMLILLGSGYMLAIFAWQLLGIIEFGRLETYLGYRLTVLAGRLVSGISEFAAGHPVKDSLFFVALFCLPYWMASIYSGYQLTRRGNALAAVLPHGVLMFIIHFNHYTARDNTWLFGFYLLCALLLVGRQKFLRDRETWRDRHVQISPESGMDFNNTILISAAILIFAAWVAPSSIVTFNKAARSAWQRLSRDLFPQNEQVENIFAAAKKESLPVGEVFRSELALGTRASQSEEIAMLVFPSSPTAELPRLYWRGYAYDDFEAGRWQTSSATNLSYEPEDGTFLVRDTQNRAQMDFTFNTFQQGQAVLYTASQPLFVSHPASIMYKRIQAEGEDPTEVERTDQIMDISVLRATPKLEANESYFSTSLIANPSIEELKEAGTEYPDWVTERYLQLPEDFSPRIRDLAAEIANGLDSPYDQAAAITDHLRNEIRYSYTISIPAGTTDPLEYFLFEAKEGFCNYSASAEVLMLRSLGIPARLAVGFAQGEMNVENTFFTVRQKDAHAWPEVYFPGYGWIEFEPTGNQAPLERPLERADVPNLPAPTEQPEADPITQQEPAAETEVVEPFFTRARILQISLVSGGLVLAALLVILKKKYAPNMQAAQILKAVVERGGWESPAWLNLWVRWSGLTSIERSFQSINIVLGWMEIPQEIHVPPSERARLLKAALPESAGEIESVLEEHQAALFTSREGDPLRARRAARKLIGAAAWLQIKNFIMGYNDDIPVKK